MRLPLLIALFAQVATSPTGPVIDVPASAAPLIDGTLDRREWAEAVSERLPDGSIIRLQHDAHHVFIAIEGAGAGFPSVCVAKDATVRVLHASAALGSVAYANVGSTWTSRDKAFVYGMRNAELTEAAHAERRAYLKAHGWISTTVPMTKGRTQEMQISLDVTGRTPRIALGYFVIGGGDPPAVLTWPQSMAAGDGCADRRLVSGDVPSALAFEPATWATFRLR